MNILLRQGAIFALAIVTQCLPSPPQPTMGVVVKIGGIPSLMRWKKALSNRVKPWEWMLL